MTSSLDILFQNATILVHFTLKDRTLSFWYRINITYVCHKDANGWKNDICHNIVISKLLVFVLSYAKNNSTMYRNQHYSILILIPVIYPIFHWFSFISFWFFPLSRMRNQNLFRYLCSYLYKIELLTLLPRDKLFHFHYSWKVGQGENIH